MSTVIKVEDISKMYRLGEVGTGALAHDVNRWWHRVRGKEDPYLMIGESNDRSTKGSSDYVWALKNVSFDVQHGDVLGIIGRNGAGKSTLLKILSRTTTPTQGRIKIKGRVASLLEVGTGFHPELSGRDNIFLNGAILGMTRTEIKRKFDEIVDFAGVERYIDTPVKRYSSGMYVRLAFGVAAHLEPEILIVDEVLAVGDAEFQKKALGKMKDVSAKDGRTVLFVSHNMTAIKNLCTSVLYMEHGTVKSSGSTEKVIGEYLDYSFDKNLLVNHERIQTGDYIFEGAAVEFEGDKLTNGCELQFSFYFDFILKNRYSVLLSFYREDEFAFCSMDMHEPLFTEDVTGKKKISFSVPAYFLNPGRYSIKFSLVDYAGNSQQYFNKENILYFELEDDGYRRGGRYNLGWAGAVSPLLKSALSSYSPADLQQHIINAG